LVDKLLAFPKALKEAVGVLDKEFPELDGLLSNFSKAEQEDVKSSIVLMGDREIISIVIQKIGSGEFKKCPHWDFCEACYNCSSCHTPAFFYNKGCNVCNYCKEARDELRKNK